MTNIFLNLRNAFFAFILRMIIIQGYLTMEETEVGKAKCTNDIRLLSGRFLHGWRWYNVEKLLVKKNINTFQDATKIVQQLEYRDEI